MVLMDLTKGYAKQESKTLMETINTRRKVITTKSTPEEIMDQEELISEAMGRIAMVTEQYSEIRASQTYIKAMDAVRIFDNMVRTSHLIYNDSVTKLNREIRRFPVSIIAGMLGFRQREYLVEPEGKTEFPTYENNDIHSVSEEEAYRLRELLEQGKTNLRIKEEQIL